MNKAAAAKGEPATKKTAQHAQNKQEIINHKTERKKMSRTINFSIDDGEVLIMQDKVNAAKIIGSTIKVWLNTDTPYEFNYENREKAKEDFAKLKKYLNGEKE